MTCHEILSTERLTKKADLRIRDIPEWKSALVFDPDHPDMRMINMTNRLIIELCDGRSLKEIEGQYCDLVSRRLDRDTANKQLISGLNALLDNGLVIKS